MAPFPISAVISFPRMMTALNRFPRWILSTSIVPQSSNSLGIWADDDIWNDVSVWYD